VITSDGARRVVTSARPGPQDYDPIPLREMAARYAAEQTREKVS
jgi:hypothetical protein